MEFFELARVSEARERFLGALGLRRTGVEELPLLEAVGRSLAGPVAALADLPGFARSTVDGFAVAARDTFGAQESLPAYLKLVGEIAMGQRPDHRLGPGETMRIATGGMLPEGADAVLMVEHSEALAEDEIGALRPVAPGEEVIRRGEDAAEGSRIIAPGQRLQARHLGLLAAAGVTRVPVHRRPRVAVLSSGDEIVPPEQSPGPAQVRDANSYSLAGAVLDAGGEPVLWGILPDRFEEIARALRDAVAATDLVIISGGSSVGLRDMTARAIAGLGAPGILAHGVQVKPGKPTILAVAGETPVVGLPGHPASALVIFDLFVRPALRLLQGLDPLSAALPSVEAEMTRNLASRAGRLDVVRVSLRRRSDKVLADPIFGKSSLLSILVRADGWLEVPEAREGLRAGEVVPVYLYPR